MIVASDLQSRPDVMGEIDNAAGKTVLWWSRGGRDYSRDRIIRNAFQTLGWKVADFAPTISLLGDIEAGVRRISTPDLVWIPCFRQRDAAAAQRWAAKRSVPVILDPLISAWDKQVFERRKLVESSAAAERLLRWESRLFRQANVVIADTECHADFFCNAHNVNQSDIVVIPVSAEEELFVPQQKRSPGLPIQVLFYGSFIGLQGPQYIAQAAAMTSEADWTFIGTGPLRQECEEAAENRPHIKFIDRVPYAELPARIGAADILMGVFGTSEKAGRVIPNKVYQSLACARPVVTRTSDAYPSQLRQQSSRETGIFWAKAGDPAAIADCVRKMAESADLRQYGHAARDTFDKSFGQQVVLETLSTALLRADRK